MREETPSSESLNREWEALRDRLLQGCDLEFIDGSGTEELHARVHSYFGERQDPPPVLVLSKAGVTEYLAREAHRSGADPDEALQFAAEVLLTNLDEEFETDHGDDRRLRRIGLRRNVIGRAVFYAEVS